MLQNRGTEKILATVKWDGRGTKRVDSAFNTGQTEVVGGKQCPPLKAGGGGRRKSYPVSGEGWWAPEVSYLRFFSFCSPPPPPPYLMTGQ